MPLPEEVSQAEAVQAGVTPSQVRQQRSVRPLSPPITNPAQLGPPQYSPGLPSGAGGSLSIPSASGFSTGPVKTSGVDTEHMDATFRDRLMAMIAASGGRVQIESGYRDNELQAQLFAAAVKKYGSEAAARKWVAPPGKSHHNLGIASDLKGDIAWAHAHAEEFGLYFPMSWEPWHIEPAGSRGGKAMADDGSASGAAWTGPRATLQGYTKARDGYALNPDPGLAKEPRSNIDYQMASMFSLINSPDFWMGGPAQLPGDFTSMPMGTL